jgi:hypothetical protein
LGRENTTAVSAGSKDEATARAGWARPWSRRLAIANSPRGPVQTTKAVGNFWAGLASVGAGVRCPVWRVIKAVGAHGVVNFAANETMPSDAKVLVVDVRHGTGVKAIGVDFAKAANATTAETAHVASTKATHVASAKATHTAATVPSAKATHTAATVPSAAAATTPGLCTGSKQAPGQYCRCQYRYHSSFHDFLHLDGRIIRHRFSSTLASLGRENTNVATERR